MIDAQPEMPAPIDTESAADTSTAQPEAVVDNTPSPDRVKAVAPVIEGLLEGSDVEVPSAQPENLRQFERTDADGNTMTFIQDEHGRLAHPIEVRDTNGRLIAQSWDTQGWSIDRYIEVNTDYTVKPQGDSK